MDVFMALDPETLRVMFQSHDFGDGDFPPGLRGAGWPRRVGQVDDVTWERLLAGELTGAEQDALHRETWTESGETPWPTL